jgi:hypothetical protein
VDSFEPEEYVANEGGAVLAEAASFVETKLDGTLADPEALGVDAQPSVPGTSLTPPPKTRKRKGPRQPPVLKLMVGVDRAANPVEVHQSGPQLKLFQVSGRPVEEGYQLIAGILKEREGGIAQAVLLSFRRTSDFRMGVLCGIAGGATFALFGPLGLLAAVIQVTPEPHFLERVGGPPADRPALELLP